MSRQIQIRRGTASENDNFTGAIGEITMDTTNKTLRVHDGETLGGTVLAKQSEIPDLTNVALRLTPDWNSGVVKNTTFTADQYGVIMIKCSQAAYSKITLTINGVTIFNCVPDTAGRYQLLCAGPFPVAPNDTIVVGGANSPIPTFYPYRTV
jgi:hypothetical protein